ncbi:GGDEF domain-containing protein [Shewanella pealeana]|uniref:Diguanylate cyclase n=1 Tax=Shewanella pealeana (strain ATCC 700345 / ANG-SQ1) TaxID=398579 RepID=A8H652_SHEPA|nr:GGDEF domain-containing protein [Shewanella pealeana]ABV88039.1 diguanylate cyclase [Shewanella pealeana ATCC 700345]
MKKLSSHIIILYILLTLVPMLVIGGFNVTKSLLTERNEWRSLYDKVLLQQLINAEKSLVEFDLNLAEIVVNDLSRLDYIRAVKLESELYAMTFAEVINSNVEEEKLTLLTYPIFDSRGSSLGQLVIYKDNDALRSHVYSTVLPKTLFFVVLVSFISFLFSHKILSIFKRPFKDVHQFTRLVASGEFEVPPPVHNKFIEINAIFLSLDMMRVRLLNSVNQLKQSEERYSRTYNLTQVCLFVIDVKTCKIIRANQTFTQLVSDVETINCVYAARLKRFITQLLQRKGGHSFEYTINVKGAVKHFQINYSERIQDEIECSGLDISELIEARESVELQLQTDPLTGIPNRVRFNQFIQQVEKNKHERFTFMMLDLDGFKAINDNYGHRVGDVALQTIALRIANCIQAYGRVYRLGGDEFIVSITDDYSRDKLQLIAHSIMLLIEAPIHYEDKIFAISSSIGISRYDAKDTVSVDHILNEADMAMYHAKINQVSPIFSDELCLV